METPDPVIFSLQGARADDSPPLGDVLPPPSTALHFIDLRSRVSDTSATALPFIDRRSCVSDSSSTALHFTDHHFCVSDDSGPPSQRTRHPDVRAATSPAASSELYNIGFIPWSIALRVIQRPVPHEDPDTSIIQRPVPDEYSELVGVYKYGRLLYVAYRSAIPRTHPAGVTVARLAGLGTVYTPSVYDLADIIDAGRKRSLPAGCTTEQGTSRPVRRRRYPQQSSSTISGRGGVSPKPSLGSLYSPAPSGMPKAAQFIYIEERFMELVESSDLTIENELVKLIYTMRNDGQAFQEWMDLSEPSSESDDLNGDPNYHPDQNNEDGEASSGAGDGGSSDNGGGNDDDDSDDEESGDDDDDGSGDDDDDGSGDDDTDDDKEDSDYEPDAEDDEDEDDEYLALVADQPPLPQGVFTEHGVTYVNFLHHLPQLDPRVHILGFGPQLNLARRIKLWQRGDRRGFDFEPTEMLRWVWRMELLGDGRNPGNPGDAPNEPPVPNPADYEAEGWTTDEGVMGNVGDMD